MLSEENMDIYQITADTSSQPQYKHWVMWNVCLKKEKKNMYRTPERA